MIFVTIGNATQGFRRLLDAVDGLARDGFFAGEPVFMQIGHNPDFRSTSCECQPFLSMNEFQQRMAEASLVICHGGCTVFQVLRLGKLPVVMPRTKRYGEHINNHQVDFVSALTRENRVIPAYEPADLAHAIRDAQSRPAQAWPPSEMPELIARAIQELLGPKSA